MVKIEFFDYAKQGNKAKGVQINSTRFYFSYNTVIAFYNPIDGLVISENCFSNTTGKHLNCIDADKSLRLKRDNFERELNNLLFKLNVTLPNVEY
jgi:hypothetical protein